MVPHLGCCLGRESKLISLWINMDKLIFKFKNGNQDRSILIEMFTFSVIFHRPWFPFLKISLITFKRRCERSILSEYWLLEASICVGSRFESR